MGVPVAALGGRAHGEERDIGPGRAAFPGVFERAAMVMTKSNAKMHMIKGKLKETLGKSLGDSSMQRSGRREQLRAKAHEMTDKATDRLHRRAGH
ncbi:CsbD family protein [Streptomyces sp. NPDC048309]|uniref:CsbD family protein n=2 Tax=unclassified Streptomyces TaxID=2593676 RepID=UPI0033F2DA5C